MVERLSAFPPGGSARSEKLLTAARLITVLSCAAVLAILIVPELISGFLGLLRSTLEALFLPFRLLFSLAVWLSTGETVSTSIGSISHPPGQVPPQGEIVHRWIPAVFVMICGLNSLFPDQTKLRQALALALLAIAAPLTGLAAGALLLPAFCAQIFILKTETALS